MAEAPEKAQPGSWGEAVLGEMPVAIRECREGGGKDRYWEIECIGPWHGEEEWRSHDAKR